MEYTFITNFPPHPSTDDMVGPLDGPRKPKNMDESHQWLFFRNSRWTPFDAHNQAKLFETLLMNGTFVDIEDSHFPGVDRLRVFPASNYVSYLGTRYKLSHILLPRLTYSA
jgi:hypothetical protein